MRKLLGEKPKGNNNPNHTDKPVEHAVIVYFDNYGGTDLKRLHQTENRLRQAVDGHGLGEYDGHELNVNGTDGTLYMYGPDADAIFDAVKPILFEVDWLQNSRIKLRYGPPEDGVKERHIELQ
ncbi:MAG: hypothetical protein ACPG4Q_13510 [Phycisphaeraceae bacterium]